MGIYKIICTDGKYLTKGPCSFYMSLVLFCVVVFLCIGKLNRELQRIFLFFACCKIDPLPDSPSGGFIKCSVIPKPVCLGEMVAMELTAPRT